MSVHSVRTFGVVLTVLGGGGTIWATTRVTRLYGEMHTWLPPFSIYEAVTITVGLLSISFLLVGILLLKRSTLST